ncbi:DUF5684 domain-containing protein [Microbacterium limosum]|uniref:DUF5684 domain-containing protein n=1 Tax=Microbacterium limosum TaxID=3079935 RepID=A0AAU0MFS4_9MICO|nr:DUF5684 domain-containing protein [Microbacterium sp. Y20]WOQ69321.1 DUF5684 domain-containing protein [Microbacterium sp. Y20]
MNDSAALLLILGWLGAGILVYVWSSLALQAVFAKVGEDPWTAWVPLLNVAVVLQVGGFSGWFALLALVPVLGQVPFLVVLAMALWRVNRSFGFGAGMTVLGVLAFPVWATVVGWGPARWLGDEPGVESGPLRHANPGLDLEGRVAPAYTGPASASSASVFGRHGPAGGPELPPRPPAPTVSGYPSVVPPVPPLPDRAPPLEPSEPAHAFRSTMRRAQADAAAAAEETGSGFTGRAPFTQTFPAQGPAVPPALPPAAPIRAVPGGDGDARPAVAAPQAPPVREVPQPPPSTSGDRWSPLAAPIAATQGPDAAEFGASSDTDSHSSAEVSAVQGAPVLSGPRAARASVSAQHAAPEIPDDSVFDETVVASRRRAVWSLLTPQGAPVRLTSELVVLGRRPQEDPDHPGAQLVPLADETRTVSKTHARLELHGDVWSITDLYSTNGVILLAQDGDEVEVPPGESQEVTHRFLLGDAEFGLRREGL